jgi:hypothetical protein
MDQSQRELRRAAAKEFMESLDQLGKSLATDADLEHPDNFPSQSQSAPKGLSLQDLEDAANDIDQFIGLSHPTSNP